MPRVYTVQGHWPFPRDMLRYDDADPVTDSDDACIARLSTEQPESVEFMQATFDIKLRTDRSAFHLQYQSHKRWESFGWKITDIDGRSTSMTPPPNAAESKLERVARALCEARKVDPDSLVAYDSGTMAYTRTHAWRIAARELEAARLLAEHVEKLR